MFKFTEEKVTSVAATFSNLYKSHIPLRNILHLVHITINYLCKMLERKILNSWHRRSIRIKFVYIKQSPKSVSFTTCSGLYLGILENVTEQNSNQNTFYIWICLQKQWSLFDYNSCRIVESIIWCARIKDFFYCNECAYENNWNSSTNVEK